MEGISKRRKGRPVHNNKKKIASKPESEPAIDEKYNQGFNIGYAQGFEEGHKLAYEREL